VEATGLNAAASGISTSDSRVKALLMGYYTSKSEQGNGRDQFGGSRGNLLIVSVGGF
jgi:hypothetical protein